MSFSEQEPIVELLSNWRFRVEENQIAQDKSARYFERLNYWFGIPVVILSTFVGTSVFASLESQVNTNFKIFLGLVSVTSAVFASLQTFFRFSERAEKHRLAAARYGAIRREVEELFALPKNKRGESKEFLDNIRNRIDALTEESPIPPQSILKRFEKERNELPPPPPPDIDERIKVSDAQREAIINLMVRNQIVTVEQLNEEIERVRSGSKSL